MAGKLPTFFYILNINKKKYNDEVFTSVLLSMRITLFMLQGYKPIRNPMRVHNLKKVMKTSSGNDQLQFLILSALIVTLMTLFRNFSVLLMRKEEKKALFEEYYAHIEEYEGSMVKKRGLSFNSSIVDGVRDRNQTGSGEEYKSQD
jgi:hypothetical protein